MNGLEERHGGVQCSVFSVQYSVFVSACQLPPLGIEVLHLGRS